MSTRLSLSEARIILANLIDEELLAAEDGEARLDATEIQALGVAVKVLSDVMHEIVAQYLD